MRGAVEQTTDDRSTYCKYKEIVFLISRGKETVGYTTKKQG